MWPLINSELELLCVCVSVRACVFVSQSRQVTVTESVSDPALYLVELKQFV